MAKISTYPSAETPLLLSDRLIGTEAIRPTPTPTPLATKNFSLGELLQLFSDNITINTNLQQVLNAGNTATQNITLVGTIDATLIKPDNIEDTSGSQGLTFQFLSKGASSINWVDLPINNLQQVLDAGNTATKDVNIIGNITSTTVYPGNIKDESESYGSSGQLLSRTATGIKWINNPTSLTPGLADVLSVGNTAINDITLTGTIYTTRVAPVSIVDQTGGIGVSGQFLSRTSTGLLWVAGGGGSSITLTTTGNSGPSTLLSGVLNVPNYTLSGLGGQPQLNGTGFVKVSGTTVSYDNSTYYLASNPSGFITAAVTSVGMTVPPAFNVTPSTITSSGTFAITGAGLASQYVRGDGGLANFPTSTGGGASVSYYLNGSVSQGTIGGVDYKEMNGTPVIGTGTDFSISADGYIANFITDIGDPNKLLIPGGNWNFETYFSASSGGGTPQFYIELYKYDGTTFTLIASNSATPENITGGTNIDLYLTALAVPPTVLLTTDRISVRFYVINSGRTITMHTENSHLSQIITTFSTGLTALNGLTSQVQYLQVGTSGLDFGISSLGDTHTFNLPTASATNRGALSSTDWTTFNNKGNGTVTSVAALTLGTTGTDLSSTVTNGTTTPVITLNVPTASASNRGALSSTDWSTFNSKESALTFSSPLNRLVNTISISQSNTTTDGYLSSIDWNTFNNKQDLLVSGTNIKTINGASVLGSGNLLLGVPMTRQEFTYSGAQTFTLSGTPSDIYAVFVNGQELKSTQYSLAANVLTITNTLQVVNGLPDEISILYTPTSVGILEYYTKSQIDSFLTNTNLESIIGQASASNSGYLSSTDWTTFNNKQDAITLTTNNYSGAATFVGNTLNIPNYGGFIPDLTGGETFRGVNYSNNSTTEVTSGGITIATTASTIARSVASTNYATKQVRKGFYGSVVSAGRYTGTRGSALLWYLGGGFKYICDFYISDTAYGSGCRQFYGMAGQTTDLNYSDSILVSSLTNIIGVGSDAADTNLQVFHNDATGTATKVDLGVNFPANRTAGAALTTVYSIELYNGSSSTEVKYCVKNKETGAVAMGILSTNLPLDTQGLNFFASRCMGAGITNTGQFDLLILGTYSI